MNILQKILNAGNDDREPGPRVYNVEGKYIRELIAKNLASAETAVASYAKAKEAGLGRGLDWDDAIQFVNQCTIVARAASASVGDGPFLMTIQELRDLHSYWSTWNTADEVMSKKDKR